MTQSKKHPKAYVLIVNFRGWSDTLECLESLSHLSHNNCSIVLVENGSGDGSISKIEQWAMGERQVTSRNSKLSHFTSPPTKKPVSFLIYDRATAEQGGNTELEQNLQSSSDDSVMVLIDTNENLGFAGGCNVALRYIECKGDYEYVWLLNNDTVVDPESLTQLINRMTQTPSAGICGSTIRYYSAPDVVQTYGGGVYNRWLGWSHFLDEQFMSARNIAKNDIDCMMSFVYGASMLVSRPFLESVGELCEDYFLYFEELDWAWRGNPEFRIVWAPDSHVYHKAGASIKSDKLKSGLSTVSEYYIQRNKIIFTYKFTPWALPTIYFGLAMAIVKRLTNRQWHEALLLVKVALFLKRPQGIPGRAD